ncbi:NAD(P)-binding Rossmann-fold containing protein [Glarea lozoyensis ATCC 20868]|uniref:NAD(P)-binding Rossmann-fold containing protein n=1 Tax=Glarea lozoyensis (strain ATCC 20868 / MF5171) TaxID=1116229 RepID=S3CVC0_GLAL2|nr:NAD(P)-binding Rossmann-fold containing protein [Glarea lozoyensis ATCC 20868]EPE28904.1 NAD(P)-binding Rossmann-fold containing protein [Glarea lozoyensis ATCC 20868]
MVNVLIIGATGYIGQAICSSLIRSGDHRVFGLARTPAKAKELGKEEVIPILGSIAENAELLKTIDAEHINIVVDAAGANQESHVLLEALKKIGAARLEAASKSGITIPKLGFIYCSGTWLHGISNKPVNDLIPVAAFNSPNAPAELTSWRPALENAILAARDVLDVIIIRPALVYGRSGAIWSAFFNPILEAVKKDTDSVAIPLDANSRPGLVHVDDVASGFHAAVEKLPLISGTGVYPIFDLVTSQESMRDIIEFAAKELGYKGKVELVGPGEDLFAKAMSTSMNGSSGRAKQLLGWEPKRVSGFVQGMDAFAKAFMAAS